MQADNACKKQLFFLNLIKRKQKILFLREEKYNLFVFTTEFHFFARTFF